ncbi:unnamed protein product [Acanthoscelides obtectus]|uniref:Uncharacterized protein n=1 Tax=Acanthoscelides obtectus TaxID=200917 RepID=A0A9P0NW10_ACAOB|nr:unnamed protein product [Acanthoscelides obtectus]CAK1679189.1 hypothetical protein AOBTE_LOCUS32162 [Acanthoscelides obtectus]
MPQTFNYPHIRDIRTDNIQIYRVLNHEHIWRTSFGSFILWSLMIGTTQSKSQKNRRLQKEQGRGVLRASGLLGVYPHKKMFSDMCMLGSVEFTAQHFLA